MNDSKSSVTIKQQGVVTDKANGKKITQDFQFKIYTDKLGEEAATELKEVANSFDLKGEFGKSEEEIPRDSPPVVPRGV